MTRDSIAATGAGTLFAIAADLIVNSGEIILLLGMFLVENGAIVHVLLARLLAAAPNVEWLPVARLETWFTVVSLALAALAVIQLTRNFRSYMKEKE